MYNKWNSRRWLVTLWSMLLLSLLLIYSIISKYAPDWLGIVAGILGAVPSTYISFDSISKKFIKDEKC